MNYETNLGGWLQRSAQRAGMNYEESMRSARKAHQYSVHMTSVLHEGIGGRNPHVVYLHKWEQAASFEELARKHLEDSRVHMNKVMCVLTEVRDALGNHCISGEQQDAIVAEWLAMVRAFDRGE